jgi:hypothetical protein
MNQLNPRCCCGKRAGTTPVTPPTDDGGGGIVQTQQCCGALPTILHLSAAPIHLTPFQNCGLLFWDDICRDLTKDGRWQDATLTYSETWPPGITVSGTLDLRVGPAWFSGELTRYSCGPDGGFPPTIRWANPRPFFYMLRCYRTTIPAPHGAPYPFLFGYELLAVEKHIFAFPAERIWRWNLIDGTNANSCSPFLLADGTNRTFPDDCDIYSSYGGTMTVSG